MAADWDIKMEEDGTPAGAEGGLPKLDEMPAGAEGGLPKLESTEPVLKQQQKKKPPKVEPHEGDLQQLVNTLSQALKQSMVASSEQSEVRRNVRAPRVYSVGQNFKTWLSQFMQYASLVHIKPVDHRAYLLTLLDQPAYKAVELLRLAESLPFEEFTDQLTRRFDSGKTKEDYKLQLRARCQKPNEDFDGFADSLMELVENAYPEAAYSFKVELARDQFLQGVAISDDIRERVFMSQPSSLVEAVRVVRQLESARKACRAAPAVEKKKFVNVIGASADSEKISSEIRELKELVLGMNEKIRELEMKTEAKTVTAPRRRNEVVCYNCRKQGHFARDCPTNTTGNGARGLPRARQSP